MRCYPLKTQRVFFFFSFLFLPPARQQRKNSCIFKFNLALTFICPVTPRQNYVHCSLSVSIMEIRRSWLQAAFRNTLAQSWNQLKPSLKSEVWEDADIPSTQHLHSSRRNAPEMSPEQDKPCPMSHAWGFCSTEHLSHIKQMEVPQISSS